MEIILAKTMGFCFGVNRSIELVNKAIADGKKNIQILGPIVHNPQQIKELETKGVRMVDEIDELTPGTVFIRAHGVNPGAIEKLRKKKGMEVIDATCPFVKLEQDYAKKLKDEGYTVVIVGEKKHPEALGVQGFAEGSVIIGTVDEARELKLTPKLGVVVQTTLEPESVDKIVAELYLKAQELRVYNTICRATRERQPAAKELAQKVDLMLVVGGKNSGNTRRLAEVCGRLTRTHHIETADELDKGWLKGVKNVGVTAGASTPDFVINEVLDRLKSFS